MQDISPDRVRLSVAEARALCGEALCRRGFDVEEAHIITEHVIDAALCGYEYSGPPKLLNILEDKRLLQPRRVMRVLHETPLSVRLDGGNHNGMIGIYRAAQIAIAKAQEHGISVVGVNDTWTSGRSAYYTEMAARQGLVCMLTTCGGFAVAPPGAAAGAIGTNPICFAFPTEGEPFIIDMGSSALMGSDLRLRRRRKEPLPEGVAIDKDGKPTRDPAMAKWLLSLAGHKGFALGLAMQSFGVLGGSAMDSQGEAFGYCFITFKPDLLMPLDEYRRDMSAMLAQVKAVKKQPDVAGIRLPSENSFATRARLQREGIEIDRIIYDALKAMPEGKLPKAR